MLNVLAIANYRSLRDVVLPLGGLDVITGPNGSGKSSIYRALQLLAATASGGIIPALAREGGIGSTLWAGPEKGGAAQARRGQAIEGTTRSAVVHLRMGFAADDYGYQIDLGYPIPARTAFAFDPAIKAEVIWAGATLRPASTLIERQNMVVTARDADGDTEIIHKTLPAHDSILDALGDPKRSPEIVEMRERLRGWRFYDNFRCDAQAPARAPHVGTRSFVLDHDGANLGAALQTIAELGQDEALAQTIDDAFPGGVVEVDVTEGWFEVRMRQRGLLRPLRAAELSDGTLRYVLLTAALLAVRPPELLVLNEPESSLHPDLLPALARLITRAAETTQLIVVTHSPVLIAALEAVPRCQFHALSKEAGETVVAGQGLLTKPAWRWLERR